MILKIIYYILFSGLFFVIYRALYARMSFHRVNRFSLLLFPPLALLIAFIAPEFRLPWTGEAYFEITLPEVVIEGERLNTITESSSVPQYWIFIYFSGIALSILYFLSGIVILLRILSRAETEQHEGSKIYYSKVVNAAFCFGPYVIVPADLKEKEEVHLMIEHELQHLKLGHSIDRIYYKIISTLLWFDPFVHFFSKELRQVHEYEVDASIVQDQKVENYAHILLSSTLGADLAYPEKALSPSPFFNSSLIKSRITMLYQKPSPAWRKNLYLAVLPLIAGMSIIACDKSDEPEVVVVGQELRSEAVSDLSTLDQLPLAPDCDATANKEAIKACAFQHISNYIAENFKYPELAKKENVEGRILISFVVEEDGSINEVEVVKSIEAESDMMKTAVEQAEVQSVELVGSIPSFKAPARKDGKNVRLRMLIPIQLKLG